MVSIIVPVYNTEKYLEQAIESVISQSYRDWEMILIDDGSADSSGKICDIYGAKDKRIKVCHRSNGGQSAARNAGLERVSGDNILFLDSDDILPPGLLEFMIEKKTQSGADIICGNLKEFRRESVRPEKISLHVNYREKIFNPIEATASLLYQEEINTSVSGKLFDASLWQNMRFRVGTYYEDLDILYLILLKAKKILFVDTYLYYYRQHPGSYIHTFNLKRGDMLEVTQRMADYIRREYTSLSSAAGSRQLSANFNMYMLLLANQKKLKTREERATAEELKKKCRKKIVELSGDVFRDPRVRIKNKIGIRLLQTGGDPLMKMIAALFGY